MSVVALDHVNITGPADLIRRCRDFYVEVIGLAEGFRPTFRRAGFWLYAGDAPVIHLTVDRAGTTGTNALNHFALRCEGLEPLLVRLRHAGVPYDITSVPGAPVTQVFVRDPAGVGVELAFRADSAG